jgi:hypothetical protein
MSLDSSRPIRKKHGGNSLEHTACMYKNDLFHHCVDLDDWGWVGLWNMWLQPNYKAAESLWDTVSEVHAALAQASPSSAFL